VGHAAFLRRAPACTGIAFATDEDGNRGDPDEEVSRGETTGRTSGCQKWMMLFVLGPFCKDRPSCEAPKPRLVSSPRRGFGFGGCRGKRGAPKAAPKVRNNNSKKLRRAGDSVKLGFAVGGATRWRSGRASFPAEGASRRGFH
jgi:hypothetical protein